MCPPPTPICFEILSLIYCKLRGLYSPHNTATLTPPVAKLCPSVAHAHESGEQLINRMCLNQMGPYVQSNVQQA